VAHARPQLLHYGIRQRDICESARQVLVQSRGPPLRNTVTVMPWGWVAIRFRSKNTAKTVQYCAPIVLLPL